MIALFISPTLAAPADNKLIQPDSVKLKRNGKVEVSYTLPCVADDAHGFVLTYDDSGDQEISVGVVYSQERRNCHPSTPKKFIREIDPSKYGLGDLGENEVSFAPMSVAK